MTTARGRLRSLAHIEEVVASALLVLTFGIVALQIVTRFVFRDPLFWTEEAARYAFVWIVALGASAAVTSRTHITMDIVPMMLPPRTRLAALMLLAWYGFFGALRANNVMSIAIGVPESWLYGALPVFAVLAGLRTALAIAQDVMVLAHGDDREAAEETAPAERYL
jgi:TRAP-type C4-dicarboxylate transport system permease small subunit